MEKSIKVILAANLLLYITIGLNVPVLRQAIGFIYLTFIPGFAVLRILRLDKRNVVDSILFSVGLSIAFLMFVGLLMNEFYPLFGVLKPLSTIPLTITISGLTLMPLIVSKQVSAGIKSNSVLESSAKNISWKALFLIFIPLLSIFGAVYNNTPALLLMVVLIAVLFALSVFSHRIVPEKYYLWVILVISVSLIFHASLISKYLMGWDIHAEYYVFRLTETQGYWNPSGVVANPSQIANFNSVASITILPAIYSFMLNMEGELMFKLIIPFMFSLVPLVLYRIYEYQGGKMVALLSTFFFMSSYYAFYGPEIMCITRQMIAELFLVLSVFVLVNKNIAPRNRQILFIVFGAALVVSHYSLAFVYLFYIVFTFLLLYRKGNTEKLNLMLVLLLATITFLWYIYVSNSPFIKLQEDIKRIFDMFTNDMFSTEARGSVIFTYLSPSTAASVVGVLHKILYYMVNFFIVVGVLELIVKPKEKRFDPEFRALSIMSLFLIVSCFVIPNFAPTLNIGRFYMIALLFLAPFSVLGGQTIFSWFEKALMSFLHKSTKRSYRNLDLRLVTIVFIASLLFQTGFVNHVTGVTPFGYTLDFNRRKTSEDPSVRIALHVSYVPEQDVFSARWLSKNREEISRIYADSTSKHHVLTSYGLLDLNRVAVLDNRTMLGHGDYLYLRHINVNEGVIDMYEAWFNTTEISFLLNENNKIYSNGASEIYWAP